MQSVIFLHSEVQDPYAIYAQLSPMYRDTVNQLWAVYSYDQCKAILTHPAAQIPAVNTDGLNEYALAIINHLARLSNSTANREIATQLYRQMHPVSMANILSQLLGNKRETDWIDTVCRKLPVLTILKRFGFNEDDCRFIADHIEPFTKLLSPVRSPDINTICSEIYTIIGRHLRTTSAPVISNLAGLLIQSYDAGRGTLTNTLLHGLQQEKHDVIETLRFDSPIHNTRRIAVEDIDHNIKKGQLILIVLAAANRDEKRFRDAGTYNINRSNNTDLLTFGAGAHACLAKQLTINMATEALAFLFDTYPNITLLQKEVEYEPLVNARLVKQLLISLQ